MVSVSFQDVLQTSENPNQVLGTCYQTPDGSSWMYTKLNEACSKGHVVSPVSNTGVDTVSSSTDQDGNRIYVTEGSAGWTVDQFANAWLVVDDGTGSGQVAKIKSNTSDTLELYKEWALGSALSVSDSDITISRIKALSEKIPVTTTTTPCIGAAQVAFAQNEYGYVLKKGVGKVIGGEAITAEKNFTPGDDTEGQVILGVTAEGEFDANTIGQSLAANGSADEGFLALLDC